ncbi:MAG: cytochrome c oxidase subunit II [Acidimicrobiia bacterium]
MPEIGEETPSPRRWPRAWLAAGAGAVALLGTACDALEGPENDQNSLRPEGSAAQTIDNLFNPVFVVSVVVGVFIIAAVVVAAWKFRAKPGTRGDVKQVHGNTRLEVAWTIIPTLILAVIAVPTVRTIFYLDAQPSDALEIEVIGKQWWWEFRYPDDKIVTSTELIIPVDQDVRLRLSACDDTLPIGCNVIHSFWVPALAGKRDVLPGRVNELTISADDPGTYLSQCAEYCGLSHANMRARVIALERDDYERWVADQQEGPTVPFTDPAPEGEVGPPAGEAQELVSETFSCTNCHVFDSSESPSYGPNLTHFAGRTTFAGGTLDLNRENLLEWVLDAPSLVPMESQNCRKTPPEPGNNCVGMPSFTEDTPEGEPVMTQAQAEVIVDYLLELR